MSIDHEILKRAVALLHADNNSIALYEPHESIASNVSDYIRRMCISIPELNILDVINYLCQNYIDYECKPYIGYVLVHKYGLNLFELYSIIDEKDFWIIHHIFDASFSDFSYIDNEYVANAIENVYKIASGDLANGVICASIASYYKNKPSQLEKLFISFQEKPTKSMSWFLCYSANYLASFNIRLTNNYLLTYINSKNAILMCAGTQISKNLFSSYPDVIKDNIASIVSELDNIRGDSKYEEFVAIAVAFIYNAAYTQSEMYARDSLFAMISSLIVSNSDLTKFFLSLELFQNIKSNPLAYGKNEEKYISLLSNTMVNNNENLIGYIDILISWQIEHDKEDVAWKNIEIFASINPTVQLRDYLKHTCSLILDRMEEYLSYIYMSIESTSSRNSVGLQLIQLFAYSQGKDKYLVNWTCGIESLDIFCIARRIFLTCIQPEFVSYWGVTFLQKGIATQNTDYLNLYKELVCDNYPISVQKILQHEINNKRCNQNELQMLLNYCLHINNVNEKISQIKDFSPPDFRLMAYQREQLKQNARLFELAKSKSVFHNVITETSIKYGQRSAFIQYDGNVKTLRESKYNLFEMSIEMPRLFVSDPLFLMQCTKEAFSEVDKS